MFAFLSKLFAGGAAELIEAGGGVAKQIWGDQAARDEADANSRIAALNQFSAEFAARQNRTYWDAFVDGLNRLPRPLIALGVIAMFVWCAIDPVTFAESMQALAVVPPDLWLIFGAVIGFFFVGRSLEIGKKLGVEKEALRTAREISAARAERQAVAEAAGAQSSAANSIPVSSAAMTSPATSVPPMTFTAPPMLDRRLFWDGYRARLALGLKITQSQVDGLEMLLDHVESAQLRLGEAAYVLATPYHEVNKTWQPIREYGGKNQRYAPYYGRGLVQLTWQDNYRRFGDLLGIDLVGNPDLALDPLVSVQVLMIGMQRGLFTGVSLADCWVDGRLDYVAARRIINGTDKADLIAGYAQSFEMVLRDAGWPTA